MRILRYPYRPNAMALLFAAPFFTGLAYGFAYIAQTNARGIRFYHLDALTLSQDNATIFYWVCAALGSLFVVAGATGLAVRFISPSKELILTETELRAPPGTLLPGKIRVVRLSNIERLSLSTVRGHRFLYAFHPGGKVMINESLLPNGAAFDELASELANRTRRPGS